jgi:predicted DNA-binding protein with PD1-like motif
VILSAIGSLRGYEVHQISNRELPTQDTFEKNPLQPADLVSMNGYVIDGRIHAHMTLATPDHVIGGHVEDGNEVAVRNNILLLENTGISAQSAR